MNTSLFLALGALSAALLVWLRLPERAAFREDRTVRRHAAESSGRLEYPPLTGRPVPRSAPSTITTSPAVAAATSPVAGESPARVIVTAAAGRSSPPEVPLSGHPEWTRQLLRFAASDPEAAAAWADERSDPAERLEALQAVCFKVAETDPAAALAMALARGLEEEPGLIENLVAQWAGADAHAALAWVENRPPGAAREALVSRVALALAADEPHEATRLVEERLAPGPQQAEAAASVVHQWWRRDAAAATAWVDGLPPGPLRERARRELGVLGESVDR
jgi:hypothetical protein